MGAPNRCAPIFRTIKKYPNRREPIFLSNFLLSNIAYCESDRDNSCMEVKTKFALHLDVCNPPLVNCALTGQIKLTNE